MSSYLAHTTWERRLKIRRGEPVRECGLDFFPITMDRYEDFVRCKNALSIRMSSLPVRYVSMDYLSAIFALELDAQNGTGQTSGIFYQLMRLFSLSVRIDMDGKTLGEKMHLVVDNGSVRLDHIQVDQIGADGKPNSAQITPFQFSSQIRPLIAAQNQILLPDEAENSDLVADYEKKKEIQHKGPPLNTDLDDLVSSVAYLSGVSDKEIMNWNVRDFENRRRAIERAMKYQLYAQAEMSGMVSFKKGNPYPSWCFDAADDTLGTMAVTELAQTLSGAVSPGSA